MGPSPGEAPKYDDRLSQSRVGEILVVDQMWTGQHDSAWPHVRESHSALSAPTARSGASTVRRDFFVFVSPVARTDRTKATFGGTGDMASEWPVKSTSDQRKAHISSVRAPVGSDITMYARMRAVPCSAAISTASAEASVSAFEGDWFARPELRRVA
jgi:hypothetical protein